MGVTRNMAVGAGHSNFFIENGNATELVTVRVPEVSPATRLSPERWVWTGGIAIIWFGLWLPSLQLVWEIYRQDWEYQRECQDQRGLPIFAMLAFSLICFLVEASVPLQANILEKGASLTMQSLVHLVCAGMMFQSMFAHGAFAILWQWFLPPTVPPIFGAMSLRIKAAIPIIGLLTICLAVKMLSCPNEPCDAWQGPINLPGFSQRVVIVCMCFFCASYALDIKAMQSQANLAGPGVLALELGLRVQ